MLGSIASRWSDLASVLPLLQANNQQEYYLPDAKPAEISDGC